MSNTFITGKIPSLQEEQPVRHLNGMLLANLAWHCRHDDLWPPKAGQQPPKESWRKAIDLYLANFCRPIRNIANQVSCVACDNLLTAPQLGYKSQKLVINTETDFLESKCPACGYPVRSRHAIYDLNKGPLIVALEFFPLCYHPSSTFRGKLN